MYNESHEYKPRKGIEPFSSLHESDEITKYSTSARLQSSFPPMMNLFILLRFSEPNPILDKSRKKGQVSFFFTRKGWSGDEESTAGVPKGEKSKINIGQVLCFLYLSALVVIGPSVR